MSSSDIINEGAALRSQVATAEKFFFNKVGGDLFNQSDVVFHALPGPMWKELLLLPFNPSLLSLMQKIGAGKLMLIVQMLFAPTFRFYGEVTQVLTLYVIQHGKRCSPWCIMHSTWTIPIPVWFPEWL